MEDTFEITMGLNEFLNKVVKRELFTINLDDGYEVRIEHLDFPPTKPGDNPRDPNAIQFMKAVIVKGDCNVKREDGKIVRRAAHTFSGWYSSGTLRFNLNRYWPMGDSWDDRD
ncbi:MAG: hypothetical protein AAB473_04250 [Patescibacteria group bacterium]